MAPRKKGNPLEETNGAAQILGLQDTQCSQFRGGELGKTLYKQYSLLTQLPHSKAELLH